jgi:hypothetical protein
MMTAVRSTANSREHTILPSPIDYVQRSPVPAVESFQKPRSNLPESRTDRIGCVPLDRTTGTRDHLFLPATRSSSDYPFLVRVHSRFSATIFAREAKLPSRWIRASELCPRIVISVWSPNGSNRDSVRFRDYSGLAVNLAFFKIFLIQDTRLKPDP